jgi:fido (protein-threonine AMPylation protein)
LSTVSISTATLLKLWEKGSSDAERLCADLLQMEAFEYIDPQHPLGGPDGGKDILCEKDGNTFVAAVHFTRERITYAKTKNKFTSDLLASLKHNRNGFIFLTNQSLTVDERTKLEKIAAQNAKRCLIYHRERLRVTLDSPAGYGLRLRHLQVPMSNEEQAAFFASSGQTFTDAIKAQTRAIDSLTQRVDRFGRQANQLFLRSFAVVASAVRHEHTDIPAMLQAAAETSFQRAAEDPREAVSARLTPSLLRYLHRLTLPTDFTLAGNFRETQVWLASSDGKPNVALELPSWDKVPQLIDELLENWNNDFGRLIEDKNRVVPAIARFFHQLIWIHPFFDGNGRLARAILALQARELLGLLVDPFLDHGARYYLALQEADAGRFDDLEKLIQDSIVHAS